MKKHEVSNSRVYLRDCMEAMAEFPDNYFDLSLVDPPYGIGASEFTMGKGKNKRWAKGKKWDNCVPDEKYFNELFRVSKNQIVWGGNYFSLPISRGWIFWDKGINGATSFSDGELAWTSFNRVLIKAPITYNGFLGADLDGRLHPTQKPVALYDWIFSKYATPGMKILDTHLGSGSSRISAQKAGMDFWGYEIDEEYFTAHCKRFDIFYSQGRLF